MEQGIIKVSVLYQGGEDITFDMDYYLNEHLSLVSQTLENSLKRSAVEKGIRGGAPGSVAPYIAIGSFYFDSVKAFESSFTPNAGILMADFPNFTNSKPIIQISEVKR